MDAFHKLPFTIFNLHCHIQNVYTNYNAASSLMGLGEILKSLICDKADRQLNDEEKVTTIFILYQFVLIFLRFYLYIRYC